MSWLKNERIKLLIKISISLGLLIWLGSSLHWRELRDVLIGIRPGWLIAAVVSIIVSVFVSAIKWSMVLKAQGIRVEWLFLWRTYWEGLFFNNFLPSSIGGDALRIIRVSQKIDDGAGAAASVIIERILAMAGIALTGLLGVIVLQRTEPVIIGLFVALLLISGFLCWLVLSGIYPQNWGRVGLFIRNMAQHGDKMRTGKGLLLGVVLLSVVFQIMVVAVNYFLFRALHMNSISWWETVYIIPVTSAIAMIPVSINGFGVREGAYIHLLQEFQVSPTMAFSSSLLFAFLVSLCSLYGGLLFVRPRKEGWANDTSTAGLTNSL